MSLCNILHEATTTNPSANILLWATPFNLKATGREMLREEKGRPWWLGESVSICPDRQRITPVPPSKALFHTF